MKRTKLMVAVGMILLMSCMAVAQTKTIEMQIPMTTSVSGQVRVWIPFQFTVAGKDFDKGSYFISLVNDRTLTIKNADKGDSVVVNTNAISTVKTITGPKLIFHQYGDRRFLAQTWSSYSESGRELFATPEEVKLARIYSQQQIVLLASK